MWISITLPLKNLYLEKVLIPPVFIFTCAACALRRRLLDLSGHLLSRLLQYTFCLTSLIHRRLNCIHRGLPCCLRRDITRRSRCLRLFRRRILAATE